MPGKRKFCSHCGEFVSERTFRRHRDLQLESQALKSSDEEENESFVDNEGHVLEETDYQDSSLPGNLELAWHIGLLHCNFTILILFMSDVRSGVLKKQGWYGSVECMTLICGVVYKIQGDLTFSRKPETISLPSEASEC